MVIRENFKIKEVIFDFENCDSLKIDYKFIKNLSFKGVKNKQNNSISKYTDYINIKIDKEILNKEFKEFDIDEYSTNVLNRLNCCDIVDITIAYDSSVIKSNKSFYPRWSGNDWQTNHFQNNTIDNNGDLIIEIKKAEN